MPRASKQPRARVILGQQPDQRLGQDGRPDRNRQKGGHQNLDQRVECLPSRLAVCRQSRDSVGNAAC